MSGFSRRVLVFLSSFSLTCVSNQITSLFKVKLKLNPLNPPRQVFICVFVCITLWHCMSHIRRKLARTSIAHMRYSRCKLRRALFVTLKWWPGGKCSRRVHLELLTGRWVCAGRAKRSASRLTGQSFMFYLWDAHTGRVALKSPSQLPRPYGTEVICIWSVGGDESEGPVSKGSSLPRLPGVP